MDTNFTRQEAMAIATGRELRDGELAIFGVGLSMLAGYFARENHAPSLRSFTEGGVFGATPVGGLPWGIECTRISSNATAFTGAIDALGCLVASGRCDVGIVGAAQVDKFGNVNTTGIWGEKLPKNTFPPPKTRLNGSGGANDIACGCKRFVIMAAHERKRFVERVDYISSPGFLDGKGARERYGFIGGGPSAIVTTLGILRPNPETCEFEISGWFSFSSPEEIRKYTGWVIRLGAEAALIPDPSPRELAILRKIDITGALRKS
ncbi:MAG: hypothetical protein IKM45_00935 [Opitutales bacterium]|nr:hypothetical protein [Opitutales bacterium]